MRLYGGRELVIINTLSIAVVVSILYVSGMIVLPWSDADSAETAETAETAELPNDTLFELPVQSNRGMTEVQVGSEGGLNPQELENIRIYDSINRGVVNITTETIRLNWFLEPIPSEGGTGSGSIIDLDGYVLTNYHVVQDAYKVNVNLHDGSQYEGEVVGKDPENDLAVVKFDPGDKELVTVPFGSSGNLKIGQKVLAIGNPFGYDRTLTTGVISGVGRPMKTRSNLVINDMIQTDASINPGNSGGPLLNSRGEMIGINTMIFTPSGGSVGIGFAVPINTARRVVPELIRHGRVIRGWLDIVPVQLDSNIVRYARLPVSKGILISKITRGGSADKAGLRGGDLSNPVRYGRDTIYLGGDIMVGIDSTEIATISDLFNALQNTVPGDRVKVTVVRGSRRLQITTTLIQRPPGLLLN